MVREGRRLTTRQTNRIRFNGREFLQAGLNLNDNPVLVPANEMVDATNILIGKTLARKKRGGMTYYNVDDSDETADYPENPKNGGSASEPILGLYEFWRYDSTSGSPKMTLMVRQGSKIWGIDSRTGAADDLTGPLTLPTTGRITFQAFEGRVYWVGTNPTEGYNYWDGTSSSAVAVSGGSTLPPDGTPQYIVSHGGRMWAWGVPDFPYRVYYSEFFDAENWAVAAYGATGSPADPGSLDMDPFGDPVGISGGVSYQNRLYLFMNRASFEVSGSTINDFFVRTLSRNVGCLGHHTIVQVGNDIFYASERGLLSLSSTDKAVQSEFDYLSRTISKLWNRGIDKNRGEQFSAAYDDEEGLYLLSVPALGSTSNSLVLAFNAEARVWSGVWTGINARTLISARVDGRTRVIAGREDGVIALCGEDSLLDFGEPYTAVFKTGYLYPGDEIDVESVWKHATLLASAEGDASLTINAYVDSRLVASIGVDLTSGQDVLGSTFVLGQSVLGSGSFIPETFPLKGQGYGLQLEVIFNTTVVTEVYGFVVESKSAGSRVGGNQ